MAQTIKIKRGGIASLIASTPTLAQGELILATGSLNGLGSTLFVASASNSPSLPYGKIETIANGATLASSLDANFTGLLIHSASDNKLYRYNGSTFVELPIAAGSFVGTLGVDSGGTGVDTLTDGAVLVGNGTSAVESVSMTNGQFLIGNSSDNPSAVDASTIAGAGLTATTGAGTATLNVDSGSIDINDLGGTPLTVAKGGTGVSTLTDGGVLVGSGTGAVTALTVGTNGQLLIGASSADPAFQTVSGVITIDESGVTDFSAGGASAISGSFTLVSASLAADITTNAGDILTNNGNISTNTSNISNNTANITNLTNATSSYLQGADLSTVVSASSAGTDGQIAIFNGGYDIDSSANLTYDGTTFTVNDDVSLGDGAHTITIGNNASAAVTIGHASNTVTIAGNLNVTGTTTTVDSTTVQIGDNIIELNGTGAVNGGLLVKDVTNPNQVSGSLLWDTTNDYWKGGAAGSEKRIVLQDADMAANSFVIATGAGTINDVAVSTAGDILQWDGSSMVASNVIDGGTF